ncbi:transcriptional regulator [Chitinophaga skermanii]|uniref:Transcriptional regulator n=1 Tax=Chitinophaga skermanii TaxID=331697 RepID=A0A327Q1D3_9BACT|nr:winged helix-turn-helix domain-containing protein [Chitinophaga skermanii]RAI97684.1 transcriptional regulator [Chitinophaga skermanii]
MRTRQQLLLGKRKYLVGSILGLMITFICVAFTMGSSEDFDMARREVLLRKIGHELLLQSGDSTSRVLPVRKLGKHEYQISFEQAFSFQPEILVNTTRHVLAQDPQAGEYVVNVVNCNSSTIAYSYAISHNRKDDIVSCIGRKQPTACYTINVMFKTLDTNTAKSGYLLGSIPLIALVGFLLLRSVKPKNVPVPNVSQPTNCMTIGAVLFDAQQKKLHIHEQTIELTKTETRVLLLFAVSPNEIIERSRLQKEIWEDEGVIVGRSLDMFISKLRKKLEPDPSLKIVVIRGKGYKLEISA